MAQGSPSEGPVMVAGFGVFGVLLVQFCATATESVFACRCCKFFTLGQARSKEKNSLLSRQF